MNSFVSGDKDRIFINTALGCNAKCKYCYLKSLDIEAYPKRIVKGFGLSSGYVWDIQFPSASSSNLRAE